MRVLPKAHRRKLSNGGASLCEKETRVEHSRRKSIAILSMPLELSMPQRRCPGRSRSQSRGRTYACNILPCSTTHSLSRTQMVSWSRATDDRIERNLVGGRTIQLAIVAWCMRLERCTLSHAKAIRQRSVGPHLSLSHTGCAIGLSKVLVPLDFHVQLPRSCDEALSGSCRIVTPKIPWQEPRSRSSASNGSLAWPPAHISNSIAQSDVPMFNNFQRGRFFLA